MLLTLLSAGLLFACALTSEAASMFTVSSPAFAAGQPIPSKYTCEGADTSLPLQWSGVPQGAKSLALIMDDPDAPDPAHPRMTWVHWVVYDIPPTTTSIAADGSSSSMPAGSQEGRNDFKRTRYGGPCPPIGRHRYFVKLYALDTVLHPGNTLDKPGLEAAMHGHVIGEAQLIGTFKKGDP